MQSREREANIDEVATWTKYRPSLCRRCAALCCRLPVEVRAEDLVRMELMDEFERGDELKKVARRLRKAGYVEHYHDRSGVFTLSRLANGDCLFLDGDARQCRIYERRPQTCRQHPHKGPKPGFCPYAPRDD